MLVFLLVSNYDFGAKSEMENEKNRAKQRKTKKIKVIKKYLKNFLKKY